MPFGAVTSKALSWMGPYDTATCNGRSPPKSVQWRVSKTNFVAFMYHGLTTKDRQCVNDVMNSILRQVEDYVDTVKVSQAYQRLSSYRSQPQGEDIHDLWNVWQCSLLCLWYKNQMPKT